MLTQLKTNSLLSTDLTTSSKAYPPEISLNFRQVSAVSDNPREAGVSSWLFANDVLRSRTFLSLKVETRDTKFRN